MPLFECKCVLRLTAGRLLKRHWLELGVVLRRCLGRLGEEERKDVREHGSREGGPQHRWRPSAAEWSPPGDVD